MTSLHAQKTIKVIKYYGLDAFENDNVDDDDEEFYGAFQICFNDSLFIFPVLDFVAWRIIS